MNYETFTPAVSPAFNNGCAPTCTVLTCSCTKPAFYWASSTFAGNTTSAWVVYFNDGSVVNGGGKGNANYVRAVRGGL